ncbi:MAG: hypothetical protein RIS47_1893 [Bacteroidota bacterium]
MKALLIIDPQYDFFEGGALAVPNSLAIIPAINQLIPAFTHIYLTQDWHPATHKSFATQHPGTQPFETIQLNGITQVLWPSHCVQGSHGATFHADIQLPEQYTVVHKGNDPEVDSYSGFFDNQRLHQTQLHQQLQSAGITTLYICGLATDYCVKFTALDAQELGYHTTLISDATKAVNMQAHDYTEALATMQKAGIQIASTTQVLTQID